MNDVAKKVLADLGGNKFLATTGASNLVYTSCGLRMKLPRGPIKGLNGVDVYIRNDLYVIHTYSSSMVRLKTINCISGIFVEDLQSAFTKATGFFTSL